MGVEITKSPAVGTTWCSFPVKEMFGGITFQPLEKERLCGLHIIEIPNHTCEYQATPEGLFKGYCWSHKCSWLVDFVRE